MAGAAAGGIGGCARTAGGLRPWRPGRDVERVELAMESAAAGREGLRGAPAGPGHLDRLRTRLRAARLGPMGCRAVHRRHGRGRRRPGASGDRRRANGADGRLLRWLHGQLGGRQHGSVQGHRHPRQPVGASRLPRDDGLWPRLGARVRRPVRRSLALRGMVTGPPAVEHQDADARHPWRARPARADQRGAPPLDGPASPQGPGAVPLLPR